MVRVAVIQSSYVPWRGYFDIIDDADIFVLYDTVQYTRRDWRNRNYLKTRNGTQLITVPVEHPEFHASIDEVLINWEHDWAARHRNVIRENYRTAPYFAEILAEFSEALEQRPVRLSDLNLDMTLRICRRLDISTKIVQATRSPLAEGSSDRLASIVEAMGGDVYLSGPTASDYLDVSLFHARGIEVEYKVYDYEPYPQLWQGCSTLYSESLKQQGQKI